MTKKEFADGVHFLRLSFNLEDVKSDVLAVWYQLGVADLGAGEWRSITRRIATNEERFPQNLIRTILAYREKRPEHLKLERPPDISETEIRENIRKVKDMIAGVAH